MVVSSNGICGTVRRGSALYHRSREFEPQLKLPVKARLGVLEGPLEMQEEERQAAVAVEVGPYSEREVGGSVFVPCAPQGKFQALAKFRTVSRGCHQHCCKYISKSKYLICRVSHWIVEWLSYAQAS